MNTNDKKTAVESYREMRDRHQKEFNALPIKFAFGEKQFADALKEWDLTPDDTDQLYNLGFGGFYRRKDADQIRDWYKQSNKEQADAISGDTTGEGFIYGMFRTELSNHEYCYTGDISETLEACGLTHDELNNSDAMKHALKLATADYLNAVE